jgi:hypothetical protein
VVVDKLTLAGRPDWRRRLRHELGWLLVAKIAILALLWWLFFSQPATVSAPGDLPALQGRLP